MNVRGKTLFIYAALFGGKQRKPKRQTDREVGAQSHGARLSSRPGYRSLQPFRRRLPCRFAPGQYRCSRFVGLITDSTVAGYVGRRRVYRSSLPIVEHSRPFCHRRARLARHLTFAQLRPIFGRHPRTRPRTRHPRRPGLRQLNSGRFFGIFSGSIICS